MNIRDVIWLVTIINGYKGLLIILFLEIYEKHELRKRGNK